MSKNYISILLPAYNEESSFALLEQCMTKVLQENPNYDWEFLMVNDGSQDNTLQQMIRLHNQDPQASESRRLIDSLTLLFPHETHSR